MLSLELRELLFGMLLFYLNVFLTKFITLLSLFTFSVSLYTINVNIAIVHAIEKVSPKVKHLMNM